MTVVPRAWTIFLSRMLDVDLENELPDSWIKQVKDNVTYEETPYLLWDRGEKVEVQMLSHPEIAKKIIDYTKSLVEFSNENYLPNLNKA